MENMEFARWYKSPDIAIDFSIYVKSGGECRCVPLHCHEYCEIEFVINGRATNTVNGACKKMERGDLFLLAVGDSHRIDFQRDDALLYKLNFRPDAFPPDMRKILESSPLPLAQHYSEDEFEAIRAAFENVRQAARSVQNSDRLSAVMLRVSAEVLICRILGHIPATEMLPSLPEAVRTGMRYIHNRFNEPFRLSDVAEQVCLSPDHFSHLFRKYTSLSPKAYHRECRMQCAYELLISTDLPVAEIAERVGYRSPSLFYRHIEETYNKKPLDIRNSSAAERLNPDLRV